MVTARSRKVSRVSRYSGSRSPRSPFAYGAFTLFGGTSQTLPLGSLVTFRGPNPEAHALRFGLLRFRSPLLPESFFIFPSSGYLDVSVHLVPFPKLCVYLVMTEVRSAGFPHSEIRGSLPSCGSPRLLAAYRVFRRLLVPRHPPCALNA